MKYLIVALLTTLITSCSSTENSKKTVVLENPGTHGTIFATGEAYANSRDDTTTENTPTSEQTPTTAKATHLARLKGSIFCTLTD